MDNETVTPRSTPEPTPTWQLLLVILAPFSAGWLASGAVDNAVDHETLKMILQGLGSLCLLVLTWRWLTE